MSALIGTLIGAVFAVAILVLILGQVAFKNTPPGPRAVRIAMIAWFIAGTLYGFGAANGGPFVLRGYLFYGFGALIVGFLYYRHLAKHWSDDNEADIFS